jgi:hypothetical protein
MPQTDPSARRDYMRDYMRRYRHRFYGSESAVSTVDASTLSSGWGYAIYVLVVVVLGVLLFAKSGLNSFRPAPPQVRRKNHRMPLTPPPAAASPP